jgi:hypothetical protein
MEKQRWKLTDKAVMITGETVGEQLKKEKGFGPGI